QIIIDESSTKEQIIIDESSIKEQINVTKKESLPTSDIANNTIQLRPYQKECIETCMYKFLEKKVKRQIVSLPVEIPDPFPGANKVLIIAHRQELLDQAHKHVSLRMPNSVVEIDQGNRRAVGYGDIIIASVQSLVHQKSHRMEKYDPQQFKAIIIDEAHHAAAKTYRKIFEHFGADSENTHLFVWGCSATIRRHDGLALQSLFDEVTFHRDFLDMIREKWLCDIKVTTVKTEIDISKVRALKGEFVISELAKEVNVKARNEIIIRTYLQYAADRKSTLVFAVDIEHIGQLTIHFREAGIEAHGVSGNTPKNVRSRILNEFKAGKFPVLVNCGILTEGTDIPNIDCILMSRPTQSAALFQQMIGRGMRRSEGKNNCLVIDYVDSYSKFHNVKTLPTLLGLNPNQELENEDPLEFLKGELITNLHITEWENPFELLEDCSGAVFLDKLSRNAWVKVGDIYALSMRSEGTIKLEKNEKTGLYEAKKKILITSNGNFYQKKMDLPLPIKSDKLEHAIKACDTWIETNLPAKVQLIIRRNASWRSDPITLNQKKVLMGSAHKIKEWTNIEKIDKLSKGQAANMITRLKEGAAASWKRTQRRKEIQKKKEIKEMKRGPISEGRLSSLQF
ncbi:1807_t:CDS:10, partial [Ambispora gerdemannii]